MRFEDIPDPLVQRAREGRPGAMEEFCLMVQPGAYAVLLSLLRNTDNASDALQESMIRIIRFLPGLRDTSTFPGWLMRLLINQAALTSRRFATTVVDMASLDENVASEAVVSTASQPVSPRRAAECHQLRNKINQSVAFLPERQRTALVLYEMEGLAVREVATLMEITDGAVKFHLHEARKNMRVSLQKLGIINASLYEKAPVR